MAIPPLLTIAGTALAPLARDVVSQVADGLSFHKLLGRDRVSGADAEQAPEATPFSEPFAATQLASQFSVQLAAIRRQPGKELEAFVERVRDRLSSAGIDLSESIPLKIGGDGELQVDAVHPDRAAIEKLLAADAQLSSTFRLLSNALSSQHHAASGERFSRELRLSIDASNVDVAFV